MPSKLARRLLPAAVLVGLSLSACTGQSSLATLNRAVSTRGLVVVTDLAYGQGPRQQLDIYAPQQSEAQQPEEKGSAPTVLFIHGGSWTAGDKSEYRFVGESLARAGMVVGVMNYRLAPQHQYPDYVADAAAALAFLRSNAAQYGGGPDNLFVVGHSAGAFNAVALADAHGYLEAAGVPVQAVRGVVGIAGPYAYNYRDFPSRNAFPPASDPRDIMPAYFARADAPPHLLLVAADDTVVAPANATQMADALAEAGAEVQVQTLGGLDHYTVVAALARPLTWLGGTRAAVLEFVRARRLR